MKKDASELKNEEDLSVEENFVEKEKIGKEGAD